jgi:hypothetical protein
MAEQTQTYDNHRQRAPMWLLAAFCALVGFIAMVIAVFRQPGYITGGLVLLAIAVICAVLMVRGYAIRLQDRIIRLEMQTRLARLGRDANFARLTLRQIVALRFASDAELPALIDRALAENLSADQIKRAVTNWQPDYLRA